MSTQIEGALANTHRYWKLYSGTLLIVHYKEAVRHSGVSVNGGSTVGRLVMSFLGCSVLLFVGSARISL